MRTISLPGNQGKRRKGIKVAERKRETIPRYSSKSRNRIPLLRAPHAPISRQAARRPGRGLSHSSLAVEDWKTTAEKNKQEGKEGARRLFPPGWEREKSNTTGETMHTRTDITNVAGGCPTYIHEGIGYSAYKPNSCLRFSDATLALLLAAGGTKAYARQWSSLRFAFCWGCISVLVFTMAYSGAPHSDEGWGRRHLLIARHACDDWRLFSRCKAEWTDRVYLTAPTSGEWCWRHVNVSQRHPNQNLGLVLQRACETKAHPIVVHPLYRMSLLFRLSMV